ncbi:MAG: gliding motility-associated C-terminal domain-containing protein [Flavobacteriales bacterium]|nr:gliding motility-associated C-terminal domain-containing protein [Flavobacteriales bacterium]
MCFGTSVQLNATGGVSYSWSPVLGLSNPNIANPIANPATTTTYTATITDALGCTGIDSVVVSVVNPPVITLTNDTTICLGSCIQLLAGGGLSYQWSPSIGLSNPTTSNPTACPSTTTTYSVTVSNAAGCLSTDSVKINIYSLPIIQTNNDTATCIGNCIQLNAVGGISYTWSPTTGLSNTNIANPIACTNTTTNYVVTGTDLNGCSAKDTVVISINSLPTANAGTDQSICGTDSVVIGGTPSGSAGSTFSWTPSGSLNDNSIANPTASPLTTTNYILTVLDVNGCSNTDTVLVTVNPLPTIVASNDTAVCLGSSAQLNASGAVSYSWTPSSSLSNPNIANPLATPSVNTTYTVNALDINGCANANSVTVTVNNLPTISAGNDVSICLGDSTQLQASGANSYVWSPVAGLSNSTVANPFAFPTSTTSYVVVGTDANLCTNSDTVVVTVNPLPVINAGADEWLCIGNDIQLNATGGTTYNWFPINDLSNPNIANPTANPLTTTTYTVNGLDINGCSNSDEITITVNNLVPINIGNNDTICVGDSVQLGGSPTSPAGTIYSWSPSISLSNSTVANPIAFPSVTTTYYLTATNDTCSSIDSVTIFVNTTSAISAGNDVSICIGDTVQLQAAGGVLYVWSPITGLSNSTIANPLAFPSATTAYVVSVTDNNSCSASDTVVVTVNPLPVINAGADTAFCEGASVQLNASGATSFVWTPSTGLSNPTIANPVANPTSTTLYTVTGTDGNLCSNTDAVLVTVNPLPTIVVSNDTAVCLGSSAQLNASGAVSYDWSPTTGLSNPNIANPLASPTVNTTYTVNALDINGCANANSVTVTVNNLPTINAGIDVSICLGDSTQLQASGANSYVWSPVAGLSNSTVANPFAFPTSTTSYIVVGTDANLCTNSDTVVVTVNPLPVINAGADTAFCEGDSVQLNASGATSFVWTPSTGLSNPTIANPVANPTSTTLYSVTGTDGNLCSNTDAVLVTVNPLPTIVVSNDTAVCLGSSAQLNASGAVSYSWTPSSSLSNPNIANPLATPSVNTTYTVNALDINGCANANSVTVTINNLPTISAGNDVSICLGDSTQLQASGANSYVWSPVTGLSNSTVANPFAFPTSTTSYVVVGTDANLCVNSDTVVVTVNPLPVINAGLSDTVNMCLGDSIQLIASGGVSYIWAPNTFISDNAVFNPFVYPPTTTVYTVIGTDVNSCKNEDSIIVHVFTIPNLTDTNICIGDSIQLNVNGPSNATYTWSPSTNLSNPNIANPYTNTTNTITYTITVQDINNCIDTTSITVFAVDKPIADFTVDTELSCEGIFAKFNNNSLLASNYVWNFGDGSQSTETNPTHVYNYGATTSATLSAININGCIGYLSIPIVNGNFENLFSLIPATVFTPNRDGHNDLFRLDLPKHLSNCTNVQIFNRWGMLVFEAINQNIGWDGTTTTGTEVPAGTYFYVVEVNGIIKKGALTLLR